MPGSGRKSTPAADGSVHGPTATWALEMSDISRFRSVRQTISYCGLCADEQTSAGGYSSEIDHGYVSARGCKCVRLRFMHQVEPDRMVIADVVGDVTRKPPPSVRLRSRGDWRDYVVA